LTAEGLEIGKRSEDGAGLALAHPLTSRRHCRIEVAAEQLYVVDHDSRNGTFLGSYRLPAGERHPWRGEKLRVADFSITAQRGRSPEGPEPAPPKEARRLIPSDLKRKIHALLLERMDLKHTDMSNRTHDELREHATQVCEAIVRDMARELPKWLAPSALVKEVVDEAVGLGIIEELLADESVDEVMVCSWDKVYVERRGRLVLTDKQFTDNAQVVAIMRRILAPLGRRIDETTPMADGRLADGSRVNAIIHPLALSGPTLTIRKFAKTPFVAEDLVERFHSITWPMVRFAELAVRRRANILISGGTGSGKTTLLNILSNFIPGDERIVTVEDAAELQLAQEHVVRLESRPPNLEGKNAIYIRDLVRNSLRMRPDRIVVGECRGGEALDMLQAMNTGHDGSLTTLHANSPRDALSRLETLVLMAGMDLPAKAIREQVSAAIDFIVQISRFPDGSRKVAAIVEVGAMEGDLIAMTDIFRFQQTGFDAEGRVLGHFETTGNVPAFVRELSQRGMDVDMAMFAASGGA
jgi:pilus assembly protein CpaF